jgi:hypothetical protein
VQAVAVELPGWRFHLRIANETSKFRDRRLPARQRILFKMALREIGRWGKWWCLIEPNDKPRAGWATSSLEPERAAVYNTYSRVFWR